jgi:hypothetical protein
MSATKEIFRVLRVALLLGALTGCATSDPVYKGRHLSSWLENYDVGSKTWPQDEADAAVRYIGESAMPMVLCLLREHVKSQEYEFHEKHRCAIFAIDALGSIAAAALPALQRIAREDEACRPYAESAIDVITVSK